MEEASAFRLFTGDCGVVLAGLDGDSVDSVVTDPPYGLSFMGKKWDYDVPGVTVWEQCFSVLKPGGHLLAFFGTRTYHRGVAAIEDAGFEIRDQLAWVYGSGFPKSHNLDGDWKGWGTALKPAWEPIVLARKPLVGTVAENVRQHGTGALNVDGCRVLCGEETGGVRPAYAPNLANKVYGRAMGGGAWANTMGRWPANLCHDGSDEVVGMFPNESHRFFYCAKASKEDREDGLDGFSEVRRTDGRTTEHHVPNLRTTSRRNRHPTVKPTSLMRWLARLVTPPSGVVLDPFMGSGSTGKAAMLEGFRFIGIDREEEYVRIAEARIKAAVPEPTLV